MTMTNIIKDMTTIIILSYKTLLHNQLEMKTTVWTLIVYIILLTICLTYITATLHITVIQAVLLWLAIAFATGSWEGIWKILAEYIVNYGKKSEK